MGLTATQAEFCRTTARMIELARAGMPPYQIARELGVTSGIVRSRLSRARRPKPPKLRADIWPAEQLAELTRMNDLGFSARKIGSQLGLSRNAVLGKLYRLRGRTARPKPERKEGARRSRKIGERQNPISTRAAPVPEMPPVLTAEGIHYTTLTIGRGMCRFPYDGPDGGFIYCAHPVKHEGDSWCAFHLGVCFRLSMKPSDQRRIENRPSTLAVAA
jgi:GcrA cell cycle regulator